MSLGKLANVARELGGPMTWAIACGLALVIGAGESCSSTVGRGTGSADAATDTAPDTGGDMAPDEAVDRAIEATPAVRFGCGTTTCVIGESYCLHRGGGYGGAGGNGISNPIPVTDSCVPFDGCPSRNCACTPCSCTGTAAGAITASCLGI
jgi:hypothetical protein